MVFKFWKCELEFKKLCVSVSIDSARYSNICFGIGWWVKGHWKRFDGWFIWSHYYYDGNWFGCRLGPFFYSCGPY